MQVAYSLPPELGPKEAGKARGTKLFNGLSGKIFVLLKTQ
jgi:hypothetical protein